MPDSTPLSAPEILLIRYGELALKKKNRRVFEQALAANIRELCAPISKVHVERRGGRMIVTPSRRAMEVAHCAARVFGIKSVSPAWGAPTQPEAIVPVAQALLDDGLADYPEERAVTCRIRTSRAEKRFPYTSTEFDRFVAERILKGPERTKVQLKRPEMELGIDIRSERTYLFLKRLPGPGGLPVGTLGRALCLLSGGIDSPVAAWMAMKRGCRVAFITFHSYPYIGEGSKKKVADLARALTRYQAHCRLFIAPFAEVQEAIRDTAPPAYRTVLYRRMMMRIASRMAGRKRYSMLITGESLGQVASQTMENMTCIGDAAGLPVLQPLICFDKEETIEIARRIETFDLSNIPEPDCCTVFQPDRPMIRGQIKDCEAAEAEMDVDGLVARAIAGVEIMDISAGD